MGSPLKSSLPKISFGVIVLNGEPFNRYCLKSLYPYAHEIIVVEGAVKGAEAVSSPDGHSTDGTLEIIKRFKEEEDPENKIILITRDGFWEEKDQMSAAYADVVSGDWLWQVDIDEFYKDEDMNFICNLLLERPETTTVSLEQITFWGSLDYSCDSTYLQRGLVLCHRIFRWKPGYRYTSHRPPTIVDEAGVNLLDINPVSGKDLAAVGIYFYHYSLLFPKQVREKVSYYATWKGDGHRSMPVWMEDDYFGMTNPFHLHNVVSHPGWLEKYNGTHPKQVVEMWKDVKSGILSVETRPMDDVEEFVESYSYRRGILDIRSELRKRDNLDIRMDDPVLRPVINNKFTSAEYNILQVSTNESRGGAAQVHNSICESLAGRNDGKFNISSFVKDTDNNAPWCKPLYLESIETRVPTVATPLMDYDIASSFYLLQKPEFLKSDLVHMHNIHGYYFNPLTLPLISLQKPTVWTLHDMSSFTGHCGFSLECEGWRSGCKKCPHLNYYPQLKKDVSSELFRDKRVLSSIIDTTLVCPSQWLVDLVKQTFLSKLDCRMIPNGIDTNIFKPYLKDEARKILGIPKDAFVFVLTAKGGMNNPYKGGEFLEEAAKVLQQRNSKLVLLNIGGEYHSDSVNIINFPYISDRNILALAYSAGDVFAYPSLGDNHPLCVMEAMACGLPVVAFRTGGIPEQVIEGETGLIADYMNQEQFTQNLSMLMDRPSLCKAMSLKAAQHGRSFRIEKMVESYALLYEEVVERRSRDGAPDMKKSFRALEYLQSRLEQVGNTAGVEAYNTLLSAKNGREEAGTQAQSPVKKSVTVSKAESDSGKKSVINKLIDINKLLLPEQMRRLGTEYGGWSIPLNYEINENSICYCAGAGEDISFDCCLAEEFGAQVHIIDPTPKAIAHFEKLQAAVNSGEKFPVNNSDSIFYDLSKENFKNIHYHPFGLSGKDEILKFYLPKNKEHVSCSTVDLQNTTDFFTAKCYTVNSLLKKFGHDYISLLKMDIEGAEYGVIRNIVQEKNIPDLLLIEFDELHTPLDSGYLDRVAEHIALLRCAGMHCVYIDGCDLTFVKG